MLKKIMYLCLIGTSAFMLSACNNKAEKSMDSGQIPESNKESTDQEDKDTQNSNEENQEESADESQKSTPSEEQKSKEYSVTKMNYIYNEIQANYPQLSGGPDDITRDKINKIIHHDLSDIIKLYSDATAPQEDVREGEEFKFILTVDYEIMKQDSSYLSILYKADYSSETAAYPSEAVYTTNIDLNNQSRLSLSDMILLDKNFASFLKGWDYKTIEEDNKDLNNAVEEYIGNLDNAQLYDGLLNADMIGAENTMGIYSYLTEDGLGISISVPHVMGDHFEFEKKYKDLDNHLKIKMIKVSKGHDIYNTMSC